MHKFKKFLLISVLFAFIMTLTSCFDDENAYKVITNDDYNIRVIYNSKDNAALDVDEYYYTEGIYSGHIEINITIPEDINGIPVVSLGRPAFVEIFNSSHIHDRSDVIRGSIAFAVICNSYF